jgi:hypothetical protein
MLHIRAAQASVAAVHSLLAPGQVASGLREDTDYLITLADRHAGERLFVDDVELLAGADGGYRWRPAFYAGRVLAEVVAASGARRQYWLDVGPSTAKAGDECFSQMVAQIRAFDPALLGGESAATMAFGREGRAGLFSNDIALTRIRQYGPMFVEALAAISRVPHRSITADSAILPLSRIRRLHPDAMRDRRLAAISQGQPSPDIDYESIRLRSLTSTPTFDTPANRALVALTRRLLAVAARLEGLVAACSLLGEREEQAARASRRLQDLHELSTRVHALLTRPPFSEVRHGETTAAGLTQIAAHPMYSRAYRLGCMALATAVEGADAPDLLHVNHSWGIYETWCYLAVVEVVSKTFGTAPLACTPAAVSAELAHRCTLADGAQLELYFQAVFPSGSAGSVKRIGWSISRERRPDILLVLRDGDSCRSMVLDAKWRSGRDNVLQAMESAHIYHDALRVAGLPPSPCVLLLPGAGAADGLAQSEFIAAHGVGALDGVAVAQPGVARLAALLTKWVASHATA